MDTRLMVLGLLSRAPMHGYDIQRALEQSRADVWADILPGSIYHALKKMVAEGLLEVKATEQTGHRTRAIHAITPAGRAELKRLLREAWRTPPRPFPVTLYAAVAFFDVLPREEVREALEALCERVEAEIAQWRRGEQAKGALPAHLRLAFANARAHLEADLKLLKELRRL